MFCNFVQFQSSELLGESRFPPKILNIDAGLIKIVRILEEVRTKIFYSFCPWAPSVAEAAFAFARFFPFWPVRFTRILSTLSSLALLFGNSESPPSELLFCAIYAMPWMTQFRFKWENMEESRPPAPVARRWNIIGGWFYSQKEGHTRTKYRSSEIINYFFWQMK